MKYNRIHLLVLDSVGIGEAPDAADFEDVGAHTLGHIAEETGLQIPHMQAMGLGNIETLKGIDSVQPSKAYYTKLEERSVGKDTMTGHWEIMGLNIDKPFRTFPEGFPAELIEQIEDHTSRKVIGNYPASGTEIIENLGQEHINTGAIIIYTSADPVLQVAAHEDIIPLGELYEICEYIRKITADEPYMVGRIIARPFVGEPGSFERRNDHRKDYALDPFDETAMDILSGEGFEVYAVGKINDIFNGKGITHSIHTDHNMDGVDKLLGVMEEDFTGLSFTNLVDFDAKFGHRRDVLGYSEALEEFDNRIPEIIAGLREDDLLIITADHGNDPTFHGTDHTREYVPLLVYSKQLKSSGPIKQGYFADIAATILDNFDLNPIGNGESFLKEII